VKKYIISIIAALAVAGCTSVDNAAVASDPMPTNTDAKAVAAIKVALKDPFSVRDLKIGRPFRAVNNYGHPNAWAVCSTFFAKNSFGAYNQGLYMIYFEKDRVIDLTGGPGIAIYPECGTLHPVAYKY